MRFASPLCLTLLMACSYSLAEDNSNTAETPDTSTQEESTNVPVNEVVRPALPERSEQDASALRAHVPAREQQSLEGLNESFLALYKPANIGQPLGTVVILPSNDQHAESPKVMAPLRHKLPDAGWNTLAISLPDPLEILPERAAAAISLPGNTQQTEPPSSPEASDAAEQQNPEAAEVATPNDDTAPTEAAAEPAIDEDSLREQVLAKRTEQRSLYEQRIFQRIEAALAFAKQQGAAQIVLAGQGSGGYWAARYLQEAKPNDIQGLALISPSLPLGFGPELDELIPNTGLAVADFYFKDKPAQASAALARRNASKRLRIERYHSVGLQALASDSNAEQEQLYRRVRGWLSQSVSKQP